MLLDVISDFIFMFQYMLHISQIVFSRGTIPKAAMQGRRLRKDIHQDFLQSSYRVWGPRFDYSIADIKHPNVAVKVLCKTHGAFLVTPREHLHQQKGCPTCSIERRMRKKITQSILPPSPNLLEFMKELTSNEKYVSREVVGELGSGKVDPKEVDDK